MIEQIKANGIKPGMVLSIYGGTERFDVERVIVTSDAVQVKDNFEWRGLGFNETVTVLGYFNTEG